MNLTQNLIQFQHSQLIALDIKFTDTGFQWTVFDAYKKSELQLEWASLADNTVTARKVAGVRYPSPTDEFAWETETHRVYSQTSGVYPDVTAGISGEINWTDITNNEGFSDHAIFAITHPADQVTVRNLNVRYVQQTALNTRTSIPLYNLVANSQLHKKNPVAAMSLQKNSPMILISIPFAEMNPSDWNMMVALGDSDPGLVRISSGEQFTNVITDELGRIVYTMPKVYFTNKTATVSPDGYVDLPFYLGTPTDLNPSAKTSSEHGLPITDHNATIYLKTTAGHLNKQQVQTVNGVGTVRLIATHLVPGDTITVSCGFQYWSGSDDCVVTVQ